MTKQHGSRTVSSRLEYDLWRTVDRMATNKHMNINDYVKMCIITVTHYKSPTTECTTESKYSEAE